MTGWRFDPRGYNTAEKVANQTPPPAILAIPSILDGSEPQNVPQNSGIAEIATTQDEFYEFEERAAIIEFDGGGSFGASPKELDDQIGNVHGELSKMTRTHPQYNAKLNEYQNLLAKRHGSQAVGATANTRV